MAGRGADRITFRIERFLLRGAHYRLLFIAAVLGLLSVGAGGLVLASGAFDSWSEAVWWAFLRLTDPGYLGDDEGTFVRTISTVLTVAGYVVFMGSLVAIMTQWLNATITRLQSGLTPVKTEGHVVIVGWTNRTIPIVEEMLLSETRVRRFLQRHGKRRLHIVILAEEVTPAIRQDLKDELGDLWQEQQITLRTGSSLRLEHLERAAFLDAAVIVVPAGDFEKGEPGGLDTRTIKTLLSISGAAKEAEVGTPPLVVAEVLDARKLAVARRAYPGPLETVASDVTIARLIAQNLRHEGLSAVYTELLTQSEGNEIYVTAGDEFVGQPIGALQAAFPRCVVLGLVRTEGNDHRPYLNPGPELSVGEEDRIVVLARAFADTQPGARRRPRAVETGPPGTLMPRRGERRVLILGWSRKVPALVRELRTHEEETFEVDLLSTVSVPKREALLDRHGLGPDRLGDRLTLRQREGDYSVQSELIELDPFGYDNILMLGSDWRASGQEADARTILGALLLGEMAREVDRRPPILLELLEPENVSLLSPGFAELIVSPVLTSHMLSQVALRRELRAVFEALFAAGGTEIVFRAPSDYGLTGAATFADIQPAAASVGEIALGIRSALPDGDPGFGGASGQKGAVELNPRRDRSWDLGKGVEIVAIATYRT